MELMVWNGILSLIVAAVLMWVKSVNDENKRISILLSKTREENAEKYVTKVEVHSDINRVLDRIDRLENKIDSFMREQRSAIG
jgi:archaellum component FlaC